MSALERFAAIKDELTRSNVLGSVWDAGLALYAARMKGDDEDPMVYMERAAELEERFLIKTGRKIDP